MRGYIYSRKTKHGTRYYAKYDAGRDRSTGKRLQFNVAAGKTRKEAEAFLAQKLAEVNRGVTTPPAVNKVTVSTFFREWLGSHAARPNTVAGYWGKFEKHLEPRFGQVPLVALRVEHVVQLHTGMRAQGLSDTTIHHAHALLRQGLKQAMVRDLITRNVASLVPAPPLGKRKVKIPPDDVIMALLKQLQHRRLYPAYFTLFTTGMRIEEIFGLPWRCVDLDTGEIRVEQVLVYTDRNKTRKSLQLLPPKTEQSRRTIAIGPRLVAVLRGWQERQADERSAWGEAYKEHDLVFSKEDGTFGSPAQFSRNFREDIRALQKSEKTLPEDKKRFGVLTNWCTYVMRHVHLSQLIADGVDPAIVQKRAGHAHLSTTTDIYGYHRPEGAQRQAVLLYEERRLSRVDPGSPFPSQ